MYALNLIPQNNRIAEIMIAGFLITTTSATSALKEDVEKPVYINADSVLFNKTKGLAVYEGNVSITQGTLEIKAYRIEINAPNNEIERITATGKPVSFQQKMDDGKLAKGGANKLLYLVKGKKILMDGNAVISQNKDKFSSNHIEYSTKTGELKAGRDKKTAGSKGRVKVIFFPSNKSK
ncbi:MAG: lipopolysaccharide transport periplasmic protein LptA [Cocleimonas sp.]|nr:lipopolysaccharide transport periplasmic protein LptA [Cocleimonas sp.]